MSTILGIDNSIGWAHWKLKGGIKNTLLLGVGYAVVITGLIILTLHPGNPDFQPYQRQTLSNWRVALISFQAGILALLAGSRVAVSIRADITSRMIESHALMPVAPLSAISGYIWGPVSQVLGVIIANLVIGLFVCVGAGMDLGLWYGPNLVLVGFSIFIWVVAAFTAFVSRLGWGAIFGLLICVGFSQGFFLPLCPALNVLGSPFIGVPVFRASVTNFEFGTARQLSLVGQGIIGAILYVGAARKYRKSDDSGLGILPATLLLLSWCALTFIGIRFGEIFRPRLGGGFGSDEVGNDLVYLICGMISATIVALVPIANMSRDKSHRNYASLLAALAGVAITGICLAAVTLTDNLPSLALTFVVITSFLTSISFLLQIAYRVMQRAWAIGLAWLFIVWVLPIIIDLTLWVVRSEERDFQMTVASAISPAGALIMIWGAEAVADPRRLLGAGVAIQIALAGGAMLLYLMTQRISPSAKPA